MWTSERVKPVEGEDVAEADEDADDEADDEDDGLLDVLLGAADVVGLALVVAAAAGELTAATRLDVAATAGEAVVTAAARGAAAASVVAAAAAATAGEAAAARGAMAVATAGSVSAKASTPPTCRFIMSSMPALASGASKRAAGGVDEDGLCNSSRASTEESESWEEDASRRLSG